MLGEHPVFNPITFNQPTLAKIPAHARPRQAPAVAYPPPQPASSMAPHP